jgi:LPXTG-motif cell wall-anchored protein
LGTTVTVSPGSGGTAFTGSDLAAPLALGGILLIVGLALLYLGRRRAAASDR